MKKFFAGCFSLLVIFATVACNGQEKLGKTGLSMTIDATNLTNVSKIRFTYYAKKCPWETQDVPFWGTSITKDLSDFLAPSSSGVGSADFAPTSSHNYASFYTELTEGCYSLKAEPMDSQGNLSSQCTTFENNEIYIQSGFVNEIMAIHQCDGSTATGTNTTSYLNQPPVIDSVTIVHNQGMYACEENVICVKAHDPNGNPIAIEFNNLDYQVKPMKIETVSFSESNNESVQEKCVSIVSEHLGETGLQIVVKDYAESSSVLNARTLEKSFQSATGKTISSRTTRLLRLNVAADVEFQCYDYQTNEFRRHAGARTPVIAPGCSPVTMQTYWCDENPSDLSSATYCPNGSFNLSAVYPACK